MEAISYWFELTYAQYLTVPRSIMEAMPQEWQERMAACLSELDETFDWRPKEGRYWVSLNDGKGRFAPDPLMEYRHPDFAYIESIRNPDNAPTGRIEIDDATRKSLTVSIDHVL